MTWTSFHRRGEVLRAVIEAADARRDGTLPLDIDGVAETFGDPTTLLGALQLRWHTRLAGRIELELASQPLDLEAAIITAWQATADELPGLRVIVDRHRAAPLDTDMAETLARSAATERTLLAVMSGRVSRQDAAAARIGHEIEDRARATFEPRPELAEDPGNHRLIDRIKAALAA